ncbi:hypothetical protein MTQ01_01715 [Streptomyces sp. XM4193]|uniref:hypothetical protein n=1 Tax=Streptomyces sp. XM4193 TaxID=2929782 RepID=UPI001FFB03E4|nr:hypothetical protein [Streptomyces sp. XM4193]MCK1794761.1 hypothetical protein [Streptomyces sp. XM4193]
MAQNPQAPQGPGAQQDPAASTQMFRAFVDDGSSGPSRPAPPEPAKSRLGLIAGVVVAVAVLAAVVFLAIG